jgi:hypothetical protein
MVMMAIAVSRRAGIFMAVLLFFREVSPHDTDVSRAGAFGE